MVTTICEANRAESAKPIAGLKARGRSPSQVVALPKQGLGAILGLGLLELGHHAPLPLPALRGVVELAHQHAVGLPRPLGQQVLGELVQLGIRLQAQRVGRTVRLQAGHQLRARHPRVAAVAERLQAHAGDAHQHFRLPLGGVGLAGVQPQRRDFAHFRVHHSAHVVEGAVIVPVIARSLLCSVKFDQR